MRKASPEKLEAHKKYVDRLYKVVRDCESLKNEADYWLALRDWREARNTCPECQSQNTSIRNHNLMWGDGDIVCDDCETFVRFFDSG